MGFGRCRKFSLPKVENTRWALTRNRLQNYTEVDNKRSNKSNRNLHFILLQWGADQRF